jgi:hypothetical protein
MTSTNQVVFLLGDSIQQDINTLADELKYVVKP